MLKKVLIALGLVIFALICFVFYLINPYLKKMIWMHM